MREWVKIKDEPRRHGGTEGYVGANLISVNLIEYRIMNIECRISNNKNKKRERNCRMAKEERGLGHEERLIDFAVFAVRNRNSFLCRALKALGKIRRRLHDSIFDIRHSIFFFKVAYKR